MCCEVGAAGRRWLLLSLIALIATALLVFTAAPVVWRLQQASLVVGVLYNLSHPLEARLAGAAGQAAARLHHLHNTRSLLSRPVAGVELRYRREGEGAAAALERLQKSGVELFLGWTDCSAPAPLPSALLTDCAAPAPGLTSLGPTPARLAEALLTMIQGD